LSERHTAPFGCAADANPDDAFQLNKRVAITARREQAPSPPKAGTKLQIPYLKDTSPSRRAGTCYQFFPTPSVMRLLWHKK